MIFFVVTYLLLFTTILNACTCRLKSIQDIICSSDWVSHLTILGKYDTIAIDTNVEGPQIAGNLMYITLHKEIFKVADNETEIEPIIFTAKNEVVCGMPDLVVGKEYLLAGYYTGDINRIRLCDQMSPEKNPRFLFPPEWYQIPEDIKDKLRKDFYKCA
uniref:NTR domain-containing protein n=1 Tax=Strongyloides papillosus TaxID=174720 RepID=A0A0N5B2T0_STREA